MAFWSNLMARFQAAYKAFYEPGILTDPLEIDSNFADFNQRQLRYAVYWSFYENSAYRKIHNWAETYKTQYGLYKYIRNIYNPSYRLGEFWKTHLWGGQLDLEAQAEGALPIVTDNEALRPAIAQLWQWSNWQINKDIITLYGPILGDVGIKIVDDTDKQKVYLKMVHPGTVYDIETDDFGNIKAYTIQEMRENPDLNAKQDTVVYTEQVSRDGVDVVYRTFLNNVPYPWNGVTAEWSEPYGFIPLVMIQHNNVGLDWGWSELHALRSMIHEVDDRASKLGDQIRKMVEAPWLLSGVAKPGNSPTTSETTLSGQAALNRPQPGREELPIVYGPVGATATPLVSELNIADVTDSINHLLLNLEENCPELKISKLSEQASGEKSGKALREARRGAATKVEQRRVSYDDGLVRAQQMAVAIGGFRNYFPGFGLDSYAAGLLNHSIGPRPVFSNDPLDDTEIEQAFWSAANQAITAGVPLLTYLKLQNWSQEKIDEIANSPEYLDKQRAREAGMAALQQAGQQQPQQQEMGQQMDQQQAEQVQQ